MQTTAYIQPEAGAQLDIFHQPAPDFRNIEFNGADYSSEFDQKRLSGQIERVYNLMKDGKYRTLDEISKLTGDPHASISAQLRHLRKARFGSHTVNKQNRGNRENGLFEYQLIINQI